MNSGSSLEGKHVFDSVIPKFTLPQINILAYDSIKFKEPKIKVIPPSRKPQPAIPHEDINPMGTTPEKTQQIKNVLRIAQFQNAQTFREQCHILAAHLRSDPVHPEFSFDELAHILGIPHGESIRKQTKKSLNNPNPEGRPPLIGKEARLYLEKIITERTKIRNPVSIYELTESLRELFDIIITTDTMAKYFRRDKVFTTAIGVPMEQKRIQISHADILNWYQELNIVNRNIPRYFIFNMDETGLDD
jgi:hypothetical protein